MNRLIIGILEADTLDDEVIEQYGRYADSFEQLLSSIDPQLDFQTYHVTRHEYPQDIYECDAYLITGSKSSCYEDVDWIHRLKQFVVNCHEQEIKMVGICFGHQLIADALGGAVPAGSMIWAPGPGSPRRSSGPATSGRI